MANEERRRWNRLDLAIPLFVRGEDAFGRAFTELAIALNISAGGALVALRSTVAASSKLKLEIPRPPVANEAELHIPARRTMEAKIVRADQRNSYHLLALQFTRPITAQAAASV